LPKKTATGPQKAISGCVGTAVRGDAGAACLMPESGMAGEILLVCLAACYPSAVVCDGATLNHML